MFNSNNLINIIFTENIVTKVIAVVITIIMNPLSPKSDQDQISPRNISAL